MLTFTTIYVDHEYIFNVCPQGSPFRLHSTFVGTSDSTKLFGLWWSHCHFNVWNQSVDLILIGGSKWRLSFSLSSNHRIIHFYHNLCRSRVHIECVHSKSPTKDYLALLRPPPTPQACLAIGLNWTLSHMLSNYDSQRLSIQVLKSMFVFECSLGSKWRFK